MPLPAARWVWQATEMLQSDESLEMLAACENMTALGNLSVSWQRELLEHLGVEMDHGCRALGETPARFADDEEVMTAFQAFQRMCGESAQLATKKGQEMYQKAKAAKAAEEAKNGTPGDAPVDAS